MKATKRPEPPPSRRKSSKHEQTPRRKRPTVLVVDDYSNMRDLLKIILKDYAGCRVILAETSEQALGEAERKEVDAVISDLNRLPGMDGFQFLEAFRLAHPSTPVIIFSGTVTGARQRRAFRLGAFRCMSKPATVDEILKLVREALEYGMARKRQAGGLPPPDCRTNAV